MSQHQDVKQALGDNAARQLANATKTVPQLSTISPRWLVHLLQWSPVEAGIFRLNRVKMPLACRWPARSAMNPNCRKPLSITKNSRVNCSSMR
ncbi:hypothetical protein [Aquitalea pelogenes]|uniref:hypothetical protein n=1 Tax=Aquitalea pelogenes TaxID=1293573 RepID=UPI0035ADCDB8